MKPFLSAFFCLLLLSACGAPTKTEQTAAQQTLKGYYFPLPQLKDGLVYEYINIHTNTVDHFWLYKTVEDQTGNWYLVSTRYNTQFQQDQIVRERIYAEGSHCESYRFVQTDSAGKSQTTDAAITGGVIYPFELPKDSTLVFRFQMEFFLPQDSMTYNVTRDRRFRHFDENIEWGGKKQRCAVFQSLQHIGLRDTLRGGNWRLDSSRVEEIYAENIGLIQSTIQISSGGTLAYKLGERLTMEEFINKYKLSDSFLNAQ